MVVLNTFRAQFVKRVNELRGESSPRKFALDILKQGGYLFGGIFVLMILLGTWAGAQYRYEGRIVICHAEECDYYSDRGAMHLDNFLDFGYTLQCTLVWLIILAGFALCLLLLVAADDTRIALKQRR